MSLRVLVHIPSRGRPQQLADCIARWTDAIHDKENTTILVTLDYDDPTHEEVKPLFAGQPHGDTFLNCVVGPNASKVSAINRDLDRPWDVLVVAADDLSPMTPGIDQAIRRDFSNEAPDLDAVLWAKDGMTTRICCNPCLGRAFFNRFNYVYHPSYSSLYCDDELTMVARTLGKLYKTTSFAFQHEHPRGGFRKPDALDARNNKPMMVDYRNFCKRMSRGFPK